MESQKVDEKDQKKESQEVNILDDASLLNQGPPDPAVEKVYSTIIKHDEHLHDPSSQQKNTDNHPKAAQNG